VGVVNEDITKDAAWYVGEDKVLTFTVYTPGTTQAMIDADPTLNRQNLTGYTLVWNLKKNRYAASVVLTKATGGNGITLLAQSGATLGQFTVTIARADTTGLKAGTYAHAAARTNAGNWDVVSEGAAVLQKAAA